MAEQNFTKDSVISLQYITVIEEVDEYTIGDESRNIFFRVPIEAVYVISKADGTKTIEEIQQDILRTKETEVDVLDFVRSLDKLGMVKEVIADPLPQKKEKKWTVQLGKLFFNKVSVLFYGLNIVLLLFLLTSSPEKMIPSYEETFVFPQIGLSLLLFFAVSWILVFIHELAHFFAVAAQGKEMKLQLSIRWFWIVIEANMNSLWLIPRKQRYIPFLAGFFWDVVLLNAVLLLSTTIEQGHIFNILKMIALIQFYKILWQFVVFLRTDFYYVTINFLGVSNLTKGSIAFLFSKFSPMQAERFKNFNEREQTICKRYSFFYALSAAVVIYLFFSLSLPATLFALKESVEHIQYIDLSSYLFWDSTIVLSIFLLEAVLWMIGGYQRLKREGA